MDNIQIKLLQTLEAAARAHGAQNWVIAAELWEQVRNCATDRADGYIAGGEALIHLNLLDKAEGLIQEGVEKFPDDVKAARLYGLIAVRRRNWEEAQKRWAALREKFPDDPTGYIEGGSALGELGRLSEAEKILSEGMERFPQNPWLMLSYASIAARRSDFNEALRRYKQVIEKFPEQPRGYVDAGVMLREMGRLNEAETIFAAGAQQCPENPWPLIQLVSVAMRRKDWDEALRRSKQVIERFPNEPTGYTDAGLILREMGRLDESEANLLQAIEQFPENPWPRIHYSSIAMRRRDWEEALRRWQDVRTRFPKEPSGYFEFGVALRELSRLDEAEKMFMRTVELFPQNQAAAVQYALVANHREDWDEAIRRWSFVRQSFPASQAGYAGSADAIRKASSAKDNRQYDINTFTPLPLSVGKTDATILLANAARIATPFGWERQAAEIIAKSAEVHPPNRNKDIRLIRSDAVSGLEILDIHKPTSRPLSAPRHITGRPSCFPDVARFTAHSPGYKVLSVPNGLIAHFFGSPIIFLPDARTILSDWSSRYAGLIYYYDFDASNRIRDAYTIDGTVVAIADNVRPLNFSHWLLDWLSRLEFLGYIAEKDVYVVTTPLILQFQKETLLSCGFSSDRIIPLEEGQSLRARRLLVPGNLDDTPHPCFKGAPWAINYLRSTVGMRAAKYSMENVSPPVPGQKLYVSRRDANRRKIINDDALADALTKFGYRSITLSDISLSDQVSAFMQASHIVSLHGAGLSNLIFSESGGQVLEIFPATYGTPAFYLLSAVMGKPYATYVADETLTSVESTQFSNVKIDVDHLIDSCRDILS